MISARRLAIYGLAFLGLAVLSVLLVFVGYERFYFVAFAAILCGGGIVAIAWYCIATGTLVDDIAGSDAGDEK